MAAVVGAAFMAYTAYSTKRQGDKQKRAGRHMKEDETKARKQLEASQSEEARKDASLKQQALLRQKRGRASTLLTGGQGLGGFGDDRSPKATLLGE